MPSKKSSSAKSAKSVKNPLAPNSNMYLVITFFSLYLVNALVVAFASSFFPNHIVLGTMSMTSTWALAHSMGVLALIGTFSIPFIHMYEKYLGRNLTPNEWMIKYFFINFIGIWLIARMATQFGFGISSWMVAVVLAIVLDFLQGIVMMSLEKMRTA